MIDNVQSLVQMEIQILCFQLRVLLKEDPVKTKFLFSVYLVTKDKISFDGGGCFLENLQILVKSRNCGE